MQCSIIVEHSLIGFSNEQCYKNHYFSQIFVFIFIYFQFLEIEFINKLCGLRLFFK